MSYGTQHFVGKRNAARMWIRRNFPQQHIPFRFGDPIHFSGGCGSQFKSANTELLHNSLHNRRFFPTYARFIQSLLLTALDSLHSIREGIGSPSFHVQQRSKVV